MTRNELLEVAFILDEFQKKYIDIKKYKYSNKELMIYATNGIKYKIKLEDQGDK